MYLTILIKMIKAQHSNMLYRDINEYTHAYICIYIIKKYMCVRVHTLEGNENTKVRMASVQQRTGRSFKYQRQKYVLCNVHMLHILFEIY